MSRNRILNIEQNINHFWHMGFSEKIVHSIFNTYGREPIRKGIEIRKYIFLIVKDIAWIL